MLTQVRVPLAPFVFADLVCVPCAVHQELKSFSHEVAQPRGALNDLVASAKRAGAAFGKALKVEEKEASKKKLAVAAVVLAVAPIPDFRRILS
jgi:hypothetical protein